MVYIDRCNIHTTLWRSLIIFNSVKGPVNKEFENYCCFTVSTLFTFFSFLEIFLDFIKNFTNFIKMSSYIFLRSFRIIFMSGICHFPGPSATRNSFLILHFLKHSYSPNRIFSTSILIIKFFWVFFGEGGGEEEVGSVKRWKKDRQGFRHLLQTPSVQEIVLGFCKIQQPLFEMVCTVILDSWVN